jgi:hypothetical protein
MPKYDISVLCNACREYIERELPLRYKAVRNKSKA